MLKKTPPPLKFLTSNSFNQSNFKELTNKKSKNFQNILAFSLIELSIVLIIIGLLVAGVTGGASLIESAKNRAFINEMNSYKQAFLAYYAQTGNYPGDRNNSGLVGWNSRQTYTNRNFLFPYDGTDTANNHYIPTQLNAPFVDLYLSKIIDFESKGNENEGLLGNITSSTYYVPRSNVFKDIFFHYETATDDQKKEGYSKSGFAQEQTIVARYFKGKTYQKDFAEAMKYFDIKTDDGIYSSGKIRGMCHRGYISYDEAINTKQYCRIVFYKLL